MSQGAIVDLRDLLLEAEEMVRGSWITESDASTGGDNAPQTGVERGDISRATTATTALDRIAQVGVALIEHSRYDILPVVVESLVHLFNEASLVGAPHGSREVRSNVSALRWRDIAMRSYLLGALAVYRNAFQVIPTIVLQPPEANAYRLWLRQTVTFLARSNQFKPPTLIPLVAAYVEEHGHFAKLFRNSNDIVVNSLCQFDFLQCVVSVAEKRDITASFPNFGAYFNERTEPVVLSLVTAGPARAAVPLLTDAELATIISDLDSLTGREFFAYSGWSSRAWTRREIPDYLTLHAPRSP